MPIDRNNAQYITGAIYKPTQTSAPGVWDLDDQANNIAKNLWPLPPQAVQRSLRFNSADSAYLNRTPVASNRTTWTWSAWIKVCTFDTYRGLFVRGDSYIYLNSNNKIEINLRNAATNYFLLATPVYRDPTAWYHIVVALDTNNGTAADRLKLYVNNVRVQQYDISTYQNISTGYEPLINSAAIHYISGSGTADFNGYMAEVNFVDSQALTPASFGETDPQTGVWTPKRYLGTYGTNGFRLSFANNSSTTTLGYDSSGTGNNWTANNFSVTPGAGNDVFVDVPSMYNTDTGLGGEVLGNYCTLNPVDVMSAVTLTNGNLDVSGGDNIRGTVGCSTSGKWYFEYTKTNAAAGGYYGHVGLFASTCAISSLTNGTMLYREDGNYYENDTLITTFSSYTTNDVIGVAVDVGAGSVSFYKNNVLQRTRSLVSQISSSQAVPGGRNNTGQTATYNFGQRPFAYAAPSGFKALCTTNLPAPAIGQTSSNQADNHFNVVTYTGNGTAQTITGVGFQPDLVWVKNRTGTQWHNLTDSVRGTNSQLYSNSNVVEGTASNALTSFNPDGFSVGSAGDWNGNGYSMVAWCWNAGGTTVTNTSGTITSQVRANQRAGFSVMTYTGNSTAGATVGHGLGATPAMVIYRLRNTASAWIVYHQAITSPAINCLRLNETIAASSAGGAFNSTAPTSSVLTLGGPSLGTNDSGYNFVAYCFAAVPGFSAFGSYTGNGSSDGPFVYLGFRPRWLLIKNITFSPTNWILHDSARAPTNPDGNLLLPDQSGAEAINSSVDYVDFLANGFKVRGNGEAQNRSASTHIYAAFAETPARLSSAR